jgi:hypothetical protein
MDYSEIPQTKLNLPIKNALSKFGGEKILIKGNSPQVSLGAFLDLQCLDILGSS